MESLLKFLPSIKTLFGICAFALALVFLLKDTIVSVAVLGSDELSLFLGFLFIVILTTLGVAGFYAISKKEIALEESRKNIAKIIDSKNVKGKQKGEGGYIDIEGSEDIELEQDGSDSK